MIKLDGGWIKPNGVHVDAATGERTHMWYAYSTHTNGWIECLSRGLAEYFVWVIHERVAAKAYREG